MQRVRGLVVAALLVLVVVAINAPTWDYGFVYDDNVTIVNRPPAWEEGWSRFFSTRHWGTGRHVSLLSFDFDRRTPLSPRPFHVTNTILAALLVMLVYAFARSLSLSATAALLASLVFAVHPAHTDAFVSISGRAETMATLSVLACFLLHRHRYPPAPLGLPLAGTIFFLGLLSKENALVAPLLIGLYDLLLDEKRLPAERLLPYCVYALATGVWLAIVYPLLGTLDPIAFVDNPLAHEPPVHRFLHASAVLWQYVGVLVWPLGLRPDRSYAETDPSLQYGAVAALGWLLVGAICWRNRKRYPRGAFAILWFPVAFAVTANILLPIGTIMAERLVLLPSVGPTLLLALGLDRLLAGERSRRALAWFAATSASVFLAFGYDARARVWTSEQHYHRIAVIDSPRSAKAFYNLGLVLGVGADYEGAEAALRRALEIYPAFDRAAYFLAEALVQQGRPNEAIEVWERYLAQVPEDLGALSQLATLYLADDRFDDARRTAERLVALEPANEGYRNLLFLIETMTEARRQADAAAGRPVP